uniref:GLOBIN domain-containing protein n=1 Tax=Ascaris lumbricoides TaxID=6252 RepID=A0A0M3IWW1_ASCLU
MTRPEILAHMAFFGYVPKMARDIKKNFFSVIWQELL